MVDNHDPAVVIKDYLALIKMFHVLGGIYLWEVLWTCKFEIEILRGLRRHRWTIWIYLSARVNSLVMFIILVIEKDSVGFGKCRAWDIAFFFLAYTTIASASLIIVLRIIAIWDRHIVVSGVSVALWLTSTALNMRDVALVRSVYEPVAGTCRPVQTHKSLINIAALLVSDFVLLSLMLAGLLRLRESRTSGLWRLLYNQGLIWLALATVAEVPNVVLVALNLNDAWTLMFQTPAIAILAIGSTRMYRDLSEYGSVVAFHSTMEASGPPVVLPAPSNNIGRSWRQGWKGTDDPFAIAIDSDIPLQILRQQCDSNADKLRHIGDNPV
ncbi:hypothetical protein BV25DRAFT_1831618 [Artomyces pyxidatus]|uniref:Uncharacterized protein n=1 Tax=Artomyces pyxidatus TaxID=48021 RepID=A0ACB8SMI2_9AGAM|nr:hypothetical protein BV25DRAFT_1831618 [Artomyces pyxidatus]